MAIDILRTKSKSELIQLAKAKKIPDCQSMSKLQLLERLSRPEKKPAKPVASARPVPTAKHTAAAKTPPAVKAKSADHSVESLEKKSKKELLESARKNGLAGLRTMSKEDVIAALLLLNGPASAKASTNGHDKSNHSARTQHHHEATATPICRGAARRTNGSTLSVEEQVERSKYYVGVATRDLSQQMPRELPENYGDDRIIAMVRDPYWVHVYWELSRRAIQRVEAALGQDWYRAKPILRIYDVTSEDTTSSAEKHVRDIEVHGGVSHWYIDIKGINRSYRIDIGYVTEKSRFFVLARSNVVTMPKPGISDQVDENWKSVQMEAERILAMSGGQDPEMDNVELRKMFEERFRRPMSSGSLSSYGSGALGEIHGDFHFEIDAELIVYGSTVPTAKVCLQGQPVQVRPDGSFTMRFALPDGRQILPAVARTNDGVEVRTIILAIERNTKELEPMIHDGQE